MADPDKMERIVSLCKRRGFIFQSSEIYDGINGFWDYGPLGVELKRNVRDAWWTDVVRAHDNIVGLESTIIMNPRVWEASGHVVNFNDPLVDCKQCKARYRADKVFVATAAVGEKVLLSVGVEADEAEPAREAAAAGANSKTRRNLEKAGDAVGWQVYRVDNAPEGGAALCPNCGGELTDARKFNMMFKTFVGAMEGSASEAYLRPETAQGMFTNYRNVLDTSRLKLPFGIAQIGTSFRNEINPRNFIFRSREFEQMEMEFFCHPNEADRWYEYWRQTRFQWYVDLGLQSSRLRLRDHEAAELSHYSTATADVEYEFPFGIAELEGIANRTDFDLKQHQEHSGRDMTYFDDETKERFVPFVIEPAGGVTRAVLAFLCEAYEEDEAPDERGKLQKRTVLRFHPRLAPIKVAVFPLVKKDGMPEKARALHDELKTHVAAFYDEKGAVGRRYRRQDEAGTPFGITIDGQTMQDDTVTFRDRDTMQQRRIPIGACLSEVLGRLKGNATS